MQMFLIKNMAISEDVVNKILILVLQFTLCKPGDSSGAVHVLGINTDKCETFTVIFVKTVSGAKRYITIGTGGFPYNLAMFRVFTLNGIVWGEIITGAETITFHAEFVVLIKSDKIQAVQILEVYNIPFGQEMTGGYNQHDWFSNDSNVADDLILKRRGRNGKINLAGL